MLCAICNVIFGAVGLVVFVLLLGWWMNGHFKRHGVKSPTAYLPIIGHMTYARNTTFKDFIHSLYTIFPGERYVGIIQFAKPMTFLKDIELIKQVAIKDFDHFVDHSATVDPETDVVFGNGLFSLRGQKWRDMRATLSPAFTSSKMRGMFQHVVECGEQMADFYKKKSETPENKVRGLVEVELKDTFTRYGNDVIASVAFGLKVNSFVDEKNEFYMMARKASQLSGIQYFKIIFMMLLPKLTKLLDVKFLPDNVVNFFRNLVWDTVEYRETHEIVRNDMIQIIMEAKAGTLKHDPKNPEGKETGFAAVEEYSLGRDTMKRVWSDDEFVAQAVSFIIGGIDTTSTALCFICHELAVHPEIQKKLQEEIDQIDANVEGNLTYECLHKMNYLDMVTCETLRMWPPAVAVERMCVSKYVLPPPSEGGAPYTVNEGMAVGIPIVGLHYDPKYWKDPHVFDPERFSDENKRNIKPYTYLPFGIGPRNCIGSRFALMKVKSAVYHLLLNFDIVTTAKTHNPIPLNKYSYNLQSTKGFWVGFKPREKGNQ